MKITSVLALNQLKRNRKRTAGSCTAIALSTALITAVLSFATSGLHMLRHSLGDDFGEYGAAYRMMAFIPALILSVLIAFMAISVISNIFQASANDRIRELGVLKCVGATKKQIRRTVVSEGLWLCLAGIPLGLLLGTALGFLGVKTAGLFIDRIVEITRSIVMRRFDLRLEYKTDVPVFLLAAVFSFVTVLFSALRPARQISRIPAVESVSFGNMQKEGSGKTSGNRAWRALWGFEGELGARNLSRNGKSFRPAIRALSMGICLLLVTAGLSSQLADMRRFMKSEHNRLLIDYVSLRDEGEDPVTGRRRDIILHPIGPDTYNEINDALDSFGDFPVWGIGSNRDSFYVKADPSVMTEDMKKRDDVVSEYGDMEFDMVSVTDGLYRRICEATGTEYGGNILINTCPYNENGIRKEIVPFTEDLSELTLVTPGGENSRLPVDGFLDREDMEEWLFDSLNRATVMVIVPGAEARYFDWYCEPGDREEEFVAFARTLMDSRFPMLTDDSYADQGYTVRISREDTMVMALNVMIVLGEVILYGFVILLTLMGFAGFISTVTANIRARSREFAVLKSVGMTGRALRKMLYSESVYCTLKAALKGCFFGILVTWLINLSVRAVFPVRFHLPVGAAIVSLGLVFATVLVITGTEIRRMKGRSLIETIRMDSIR